MNEFDFLKKLKQNFNFDLTGDDCAVLPFANGTDLLVTADMLVEGIDFRLEWASPEDVGRKSLAVSLSDIAAMGGDAKWALFSMGIPDRLWNEDFLFPFYNGINKLAQEFGVRIAGGDISRNPGPMVIDSIVVGSCPEDAAVLRSGAKEGDLICVTGPLGGAAGGLRILESGARGQPEPEFESQEPVSRQLNPTPQLILGNILRTRRLVTSMIDISDGLSSDLPHICERSGKGAVIDAALVPVDPNLEKIDPELLLPFNSPLDAALNGGEDFELLFTSPAAVRKEVEELGCCVIGRIVADPSTLDITADGSSRRMRPSGYAHFGEDQ
ncbi:MAG: thiamine-phosphate kinase [Acidobacteriota bacterium]|nr:MAG: thiamine-phosphate kinase [Acidobacteriota bacterium]